MTRLSALALEEVAASFSRAGVSEVRDQASLTETLILVRNRVRSSTATQDLASQRIAIQRCVSPLIAWLENEPDIAALSLGQKVDLLWNLYSASVSRTTLADNFPLICGSEETWNDTMSELWMVGPTPSPGSNARNWFRGRAHWWLLLMGLVGILFDQYLASGRWRFYSMIFSTSCIGLASAIWYWFSGSPTESHALPEPNPTWLQPRPSAFVPPHGGSQNLPPPSAPPLPGNEQSVQQQAASSAAPSFAPGTRVILNGTGTAAALQGQFGVIENLHGSVCDVRLDSGLVLSQVAQSGLTMVPPGLASMTGSVANNNGSTTGVSASGIAQTGAQVYAPFAADASLELVKQQAARLRSALEKASALQSMQPAWAQLFWQAVKNEVDLVGLQERVKALLTAHGYVGPSTVGPPRVEELKRQLSELEVAGSTPHGSGGVTLQTTQIGGMASDPEQMAWHLKLPADLQRAGPEIYRNIRAEGVASVRQWVNEQHVGLEARNTSQFQDLFTAATIIDFELADCQSETMLMSRLATSDTLEIQLRKLGSFIYFRRTKDKNGAMRMLGVRAPGTNADIAPKWMLDDANVFSKAEFQRIERGRKLGGQDGSGGSAAKGGGKGRKGGGRHGNPGGGPRPKKSGPATQG